MPQEIKELAQEMKNQIDAVKAIAEDFKGKMQHNDKITEGAKQAADEAITKLNDMKAAHDDMQQKLARRGEHEGDTQVKSFGEQFVGTNGENLSMADFGKNDRAAIQIKGALMTTPAPTGTTAGVHQTTRLPGILTPPERAMTVRDLLLPGSMDGNALEYIRESGFTNGAGMVAESVLKPESTLSFETITSSPKVIAHWLKASRQVLDDMAQLKSHIDGRLLYGLKLKEEAQLLNGDGTGQNLLGIIPQATAYTAPLAVANATRIDTLRLAMLQSLLAEYPATGFVLNPIDWAGIELTKDSTGQYIIGVPQGGATPTMWSLPVVQTQAITSSKFLTGSFSMAAQVFDRWQSSIEVGYEGQDFVKNLLTILAEERLALAVYRPESFVYGALPA